MCSAPRPPAPASPPQPAEGVHTSHRLDPGKTTRSGSAATPPSGFLPGHTFSPDISEESQRSQTALPAPPPTRSQAGGRNAAPQRQGRKPARPRFHAGQPPAAPSFPPPAKRAARSADPRAGLGGSRRGARRGRAPRPSPGQRGATSPARAAGPLARRRPGPVAGGPARRRCRGRPQQAGEPLRDGAALSPGPRRTRSGGLARFSAAPPPLPSSPARRGSLPERSEAKPRRKAASRGRESHRRRREEEEKEEEEGAEDRWRRGGDGGRRSRAAGSRPPAAQPALPPDTPPSRAEPG